jgi:lipopolysaccharide export system protein LptC
MKKVVKPRTILLFVSVCLFLTVLGVAFREKKRPIVVSQDTANVAETDANLELSNVSYSTLGSDNFRLWELNARTARVFEEGKKIILEDLQITFYQRSGSPYQLKADKGELDIDTRNIRINGNVKAVLPDNATIETQSAFYDNTSRAITSHDPLIITRGSIVMQGVGMKADLGAETVSILNNVRVMGN